MVGVNMLVRGIVQYVCRTKKGDKKMCFIRD